MYRHGDILLRPMAAVCVHYENARQSLVLAHGEATGHAHVLTALPDGALLSATSGGRTLLRVLAPASLTHPEHAKINIPTGDYEVVRQRVYEPRGPRWVTD